jgi:endogenous inhibitor of DNA gyrase (YacG/DUF329 family)
MPDEQCCNPEAPQVPCAKCGKTVFTCERKAAVNGSYLCPLHPAGVKDIDGLWFCSDECWNNYFDIYDESAEDDG